MPKDVRKVLFLPKWYPDKYDLQFGVFLQKHAKAVSRYAKVAVLYVTPDEKQQEKFIVDKTEENGFPEVRIYYKKSNSGFTPLRKLLNLSRYWKGMKRGMRMMDELLGKPDIIHVNILSRPGYFALKRKQKEGIPYVITEQWTGYGSNKFGEKGSWAKKMSLKIGKNASAILTVSNSLKGHMQRHGFENNFKIISNIIEDVDLASLPQPEPGKTRMITIADLDEPKKNTGAVIRTFAKIAEEREDIEFHLIGGGPDEELLRDLAKSTGLLDKQIFMYGRKFNDFVYDTVPRMNFLITNSNFETFSVATAEALINGKPVIVSRCGGPEEFVTPEVGLVIDKEADDQLEQAMRYMIDHHSEYDPKALAAYAHSKFSYEQVGKHFMEIYHQALNA